MQLCDYSSRVLSEASSTMIMEPRNQSFAQDEK